MAELKQKLKDAFTDDEKNDEALHGSLFYDPEHRKREYNKETRKWVYADHTVEIWGSYGKYLHNEGIEYKLAKEFGGEDQGSDYYTVYEFRKGGEVVYVKFYGYYQSYNGAEYMGWEFVKPVEMKVTKYLKE